MKRLLLGLLLLLVSCGSPEIPSPAPTQEAISISFPSALKSWSEKISNCSSNNPNIALYLNPFLDDAADFQISKISLYLGEPAQVKQPSYLSQIGWEQMIVVINQLNNLSQVSTEELRSIYAGKIQNWGNDSSESIQVWVLPAEDPARILFERAISTSGILAPEARLAPDSEAMLEAIASDQNAIGYIPGSMLSVSDQSLVSKVKGVQLEDSLQEELRLPVIAITQEEPEDLLRELLICVQNDPPK
jgi:hypothetical protein